MSQIVTVLCRAVTVNFETSRVIALFKDYGLPLETLGVDLLNIFKLQTTSPLYMKALLIDLETMRKRSDVDFSRFEVIEDFYQIIAELEYQLSNIRIRQGRLINIQFQGINTIILEFIRP